MRRLLPAAAVLAALTSCGTAPHGTSDGTGTSAACSIAVGGISITPMSLSVTSDTLTCTDTPASCGSGTATLTRSVCSDGYTFALAAGSTTVTLRIQITSSGFNGGGQLEDGSALTGALTIFGVTGTQVPPPSGTTEMATFVLDGTPGTGAQVTGQLTTTW